ncbi:hypothetical protein ABVK25_009884 [Lepraria finkii]|uniref:DNA/RNA-binding domain-containing protein n=1 Tax=Lepraria finkii TaxID=1340010 RepID=A0ABR4AYT7_9LECA
MAEGLEAEPEMLLQPETRPISHEQLVIEVKGIYAGLVMVEAKCIDIDERQSAAAQEKYPSRRVNLKNDQWQSLITSHKQLLHERHDFFLASQHPSASPALSRIAAKYGMPARMWRHGIHAFLEVLRHRLPESLEHMLAFIYIAYTMTALLYETVSTFEDTWIECLGDLDRYRMAIEDDEFKDREVWSDVTCFWYNKAADKSPSVGRLYHHLAILARPHPLVELSLYVRALTCVSPFGRAGEARSPPGRYDIQHRAKSKSAGNCAIVSHFTTLSDQYISKHKEQSSISSSGSNAGSIQDSDNQRESTFKTISQDECSAKRWLISAVFSHLCPRIYQKGIRLREQLASCSGLLSARILLSFSLIVPTTARTIPKTTESAEIASSITVAASSLTGLSYVAFLAAVLSVAFYMAALRDPISVWGCMMSIWAFGWWAIKDDAHTTLWDCGTVFALWTISTFYYGQAAFRKYRISSSTSLVVILGALLLDVATVSMITPTEASTAQSGLLLSLSLPFTTLTLAAIVYLLATIQAYPAVEHDHQLEAGIQVSNHNVQHHPQPQRQYLYQPAAEHYCKYAELPTTTAGSH